MKYSGRQRFLARAKGKGDRSARRISGDYYLSSMTAFVLARIPGQIRRQFGEQNRMGGCEFESSLDHHTVLHFSYLSEKLTSRRIVFSAIGVREDDANLR